MYIYLLKYILDGQLTAKVGRSINLISRLSDYAPNTQVYQVWRVIDDKAAEKSILLSLVSRERVRNEYFILEDQADFIKFYNTLIDAICEWDLTNWTKTRSQIRKKLSEFPIIGPDIWSTQHVNSVFATKLSGPVATIESIMCAIKKTKNEICRSIMKYVENVTSDIHIIEPSDIHIIEPSAIHINKEQCPREDVVSPSEIEYFDAEDVLEMSGKTNMTRDEIVEWIYYYAIRNKGSHLRAKKLIFENPEYSCYYARRIVMGRLDQSVEEMIFKYPRWIHYYSKYVVNGPIPEAEQVLAADLEYLDKYNKLHYQQ